MASRVASGHLPRLLGRGPAPGCAEGVLEFGDRELRKDGGRGARLPQALGTGAKASGAIMPVRLSAGGRWIRTSSTRAPVIESSLFCADRLLGTSRRGPRVLLGCYDLTREEISVTLIHRDRLHGLKEPARDPGAVRGSAWRCPTIWTPTGMPSIASIGTVTAGAPRIEVGLVKTESPVLPRPRGAGPGEPKLISASGIVNLADRGCLFRPRSA